jgi:hypothetical protein
VAKHSPELAQAVVDSGALEVGLLPLAAPAAVFALPAPHTPYPLLPYVLRV